jgi:hypothetical protein
VKNSTVVSPRGATIVGLATVAMGVVVVLLALRPDAALEAPRWVVVLTGLIFVLGGAAIIVGYGLAGASADGQLPPGTPVAVRVIQLALGLGLLATMTVVAGWIAFAPGEQRFGGTLALPFVAWHGASNETLGRIVFGAGAVLMLAVVAATGIRQIARQVAAERRAAARQVFRIAREEPRD